MNIKKKKNQKKKIKDLNLIIRFHVVGYSRSGSMQLTFTDPLKIVIIDLKQGK